ncbi:hypothetical protein HOY80DRAFT_1042622 [Tuber brumale]|nr:hypothetical protein HOY80DRAFT_1042622 [Tuber brumale]
MGLDKTHYALTTLLYLKYIVAEAGAGRALPCFGGKSVAELEGVPRIIGDNRVRAMRSLILQTGVQLVNLYLSRQLNHTELYCTSDIHGRRKAIHLISYSSYRAHHGNRTTCRPANTGFKLSMNRILRNPAQPRPVTPQYDWDLPLAWLFAQVTDQDELGCRSPRRLNSAITAAKCENITLEEANDRIKSLASPWTIRRREETRDLKGQPLGSHS